VGKRSQSPRSRKTEPNEIGRRIFLNRMAFGGGLVVLAQACKAPLPTKVDANAPVKPGWAKPLVSSHQTFTNDEYDVMAATVERVIPKDQDPGAIDANVPGYIDRMLVSPELHEVKEVLSGGFIALGKRAETKFQKPFTQLSPEQQDELIEEFRKAPEGSGKQHFFDTLVIMTLEGFLGDPSYGGNKDRIGWTLVGFDTSMPGGYMPDMKYDHKEL
jgi:gluconate 2-dehydrogenase gamma chain